MELCAWQEDGCLYVSQNNFFFLIFAYTAYTDV